MQWLAPVFGVVAFASGKAGGLSHDASVTLGVTVVTALWWMTESVAIHIASLVPIALLPLFGVLPAKTAVAQSYGHPLILLLLGGFFVERDGAWRSSSPGHWNGAGVWRRERGRVIRPRALVLGFMLAASMLSMWISNTATVLMLLPISLAVLQSGGRDPKVTFLAAPLMMAIAYSASVGGLGSPIGTPPNLVFLEQYEEVTGTPMSFTRWMSFGVPVVLVMIPLMWLWLGRSLGESFIGVAKGREVRPAERRMLVVFSITALGWMTRLEPWRVEFMVWLEQANDASVAFLGVIALFLIPDGSGRAPPRLGIVQGCSVGVLLLFGGGICLAAGIKDSGLSEIIAGSLSGLGSLPLPVLVLTICFFMTFLTELTSNTASTILVMPILASVALSNDLDPAVVMLPAALSASCAFMLPVATAPNAVVFASGHLTVPRMMREGVVLNLIGVLISLYCWIKHDHGP